MHAWRHGCGAGNWFEVTAHGGWKGCKYSRRMERYGTVAGTAQSNVYTTTVQDGSDRMASLHSGILLALGVAAWVVQPHHSAGTRVVRPLAPFFGCQSVLMSQPPTCTPSFAASAACLHRTALQKTVQTGHAERTANPCHCFDCQGLPSQYACKACSTSNHNLMEPHCVMTQVWVCQRAKKCLSYFTRHCPATPTSSQLSPTHRPDILLSMQRSCSDSAATHKQTSSVKTLVHSAACSIGVLCYKIA